jgi:hypothetical protein
MAIGQNIDWARINEILGSQGAQNVMGLTGAFLKSKGENDRADRMMGATNEQTRARLLQDHTQFGANMDAELTQSRRGQQMQRAVGAMNATNLGENENFATRNRILSAILPNMRGGNFAPGDANVARAMGSRPSPFAGGIPPEALAALSEQATAGAIADRSKMLANIDPEAAMPNFARMGFSPEMDDEFNLTGYADDRLAALGQEDADLDERIQRALVQDYEGIMRLPGDPKQEEKKGGFWSGLGKVLKVAAPIAAAFIPGVGPIASAAIAGGGAAAGGLMSGDSLQQALLGGAMSAGGAYGARNLPRVQPGGGMERTLRTFVPPGARR